MAFLDNSGDIILDAVLTDAGRKRMAEGKFNIAKYAFGDEEINYELFNNAHPSGSAFYDLQIMQTPILEAFTNNTSTMSSKLMTMSDNNFLYLPTLKLNEIWGQDLSTAPGGVRSYSARSPDGDAQHAGYFVVTVDSNTEDLFRETINGSDQFFSNSGTIPIGLILGAEESSGFNGTFICVDQGIGGTQEGLSLRTTFPDELRETAYMIRIDNRLGRIVNNPLAVRGYGSENGGPIASNATSGRGRMRMNGSAHSALTSGMQGGSPEDQSYAFVDDDNIATYYITNQQNNMLITDIKTTLIISDDFPSTNVLNDTNTISGKWKARQVFQDGPVGSRLMFTIRAQDTVANSYDLFGTKTKTLSRKATLASLYAGESVPAAPKVADTASAASINVRYIDTTVSVIGVTTGYRVDIPVRFVKRTS